MTIPNITPEIAAYVKNLMATTDDVDKAVLVALSNLRPLLDMAEEHCPECANFCSFAVFSSIRELAIATGKDWNRLQALSERINSDLKGLGFMELPPDAVPDPSMKSMLQGIFSRGDNHG